MSTKHRPDWENMSDADLNRCFTRAFWPCPIDERNNTYWHDDDKTPEDENHEWKPLPDFCNNWSEVRAILVASKHILPVEHGAPNDEHSRCRRTMIAMLTINLGYLLKPFVTEPETTPLQPEGADWAETPLTDGILRRLGPGDGTERMYERNIWLHHARTLEGLLYQAREQIPAPRSEQDITEDLAIAIRQCQVGLQQSGANPVQVLSKFAERVRRHAPRPDEQRIGEAVERVLLAEFAPSEPTEWVDSLRDRIMSALRPLLAGQVAGREDKERFTTDKRGPKPNTWHIGFAGGYCEVVISRHADTGEPIADIHSIRISKTMMPAIEELERKIDAAMRPEQPEGAKRPADRPQDAQ